MGLLEIVEENVKDTIDNIGRGVTEAVFPPMDIFWEKGNIRVRADVGGFLPKEIDINLEKNILIISGKRKKSTREVIIDEPKNTLISSSRPQKFRTVINLPFDPDVEMKDKAGAIIKPTLGPKRQLENGVLDVLVCHIPSKESFEVT